MKSPFVNLRLPSLPINCLSPDLIRMQAGLAANPFILGQPAVWAFEHNKGTHPFKP